MPQALSNNSFLCGGVGFPDCPEPPSESQGLSAGAIAGIVVGSVVGVLLLGLLIWWRTRGEDEWSRGTFLAFKEFDPPLTAQAIVKLTDCFSDEYAIGRGGFGSVYR